MLCARRGTSAFVAGTTKTCEPTSIGIENRHSLGRLRDSIHLACWDDNRMCLVNVEGSCAWCSSHQTNRPTRRDWEDEIATTHSTTLSETWLHNTNAPFLVRSRSGVIHESSRPARSRSPEPHPGRHAPAPPMRPPNTGSPTSARGCATCCDQRCDDRDGRQCDQRPADRLRQSMGTDYSAQTSAPCDRSTRFSSASRYRPMTHPGGFISCATSSSISTGR